MIFSACARSKWSLLSLSTSFRAQRDLLSSGNYIRTWMASQDTSSFRGRIQSWIRDHLTSSPVLLCFYSKFPFKVVDFSLLLFSKVWKRKELGKNSLEDKYEKRQNKRRWSVTESVLQGRWQVGWKLCSMLSRTMKSAQLLKTPPTQFQWLRYCDSSSSTLE